MIHDEKRTFLSQGHGRTGQGLKEPGLHCNNLKIIIKLVNKGEMAKNLEGISRSNRAL